MEMYEEDHILNVANAVIYHYLEAFYQEYGQQITSPIGEICFKSHPFVLTAMLTANKSFPGTDVCALDARSAYQLGNQVIFDRCLEPINETGLSKIKEYIPYRGELDTCYIRCLWVLDYRYRTADSWQILIWFEVPFYSSFNAPDYYKEFSGRVAEHFCGKLDELGEKKEDWTKEIMKEYERFLEDNISTIWPSISRYKAGGRKSEMVDLVSLNIHQWLDPRELENA